MRRNKAAGQAIVEFALSFSLFLILLLGGIDLAWDLNQKSNFDYVVTQAATCVDTAGCNPTALAPQTASGLGLNPANLNLQVSGKQVTATYQGVSLTHFLPAIQFSATVTAP
jgi:Flp pilus assembly protein TadG